MKRQLRAIVLAVLAFALVAADPLPASAQAPSAGAGDLQARVASIVDRFPGDTAAGTAALCAELIGLGSNGLARTFALVLPPGANDAKVRFAVNGLTVYVTRTGAEAERQMFVKALLAALAGSRDSNVAAFFIAQIQLTGRAEAVKPLAKYLADRDLAAPAAAALQAIGGPEAAKVLLKALNTAPPSAKPSIVDALGDLRSREAVKKLIPLTGSPDEVLRRAARAALANIGDPASAPALTNVPVTASHRERSEAAGLYLLFARRLAASGQAAEALAAARAILASHGGPGESQVAAEALSLIV
jgi:HEAT repeat protein